MGNSMPPPASFDLVDSFARRRGDEVEIVLAEPASEIVGAAIEVELRRGKQSARAIGALSDDSAGRRLTVRLRRAELSDGVWTLMLRQDGVDKQQLAARLLVQDERPVVLLWGAKGTHSLPSATRPAPGFTRRTAVLGGELIDQALSLLSPDRAERLRSRARATARRVLR